MTSDHQPRITEFAEGLMHIHGLLLYLNDIQAQSKERRQKMRRIEQSVLDMIILELEDHILKCTDEHYFDA